MKNALLRLAGIALLFLPSVVRAAAPSPMVDGDCAEYPALGSPRLQVAAGIDLYIYQDEHYVWLCYTYPEGSKGQLDMTLKPPSLPTPLNLHVSAQLGEWPVGRDDLTPKYPESELWWNVSGWTANTLRFNGMDRNGDKQSVRMKSSKARELQLSKQRFGRGEWQLALAIYQIRNPDGSMRQVNYPASGTFPLTVQ